MAPGMPSCWNCACSTKGGHSDDRWYEKNLPQADRICDEYLEEIQKEQYDLNPA
jgi:hypothetical protein